MHIKQNVRFTLLVINQSVFLCWQIKKCIINNDNQKASYLFTFMFIHISANKIQKACIHTHGL